jgi:predicted dinucleotide-binding enzyme
VARTASNTHELRSNRRKFGAIGAGVIGQALAGHIVRAGHDVTLSNSRGPDSLTDVVIGLGPQAGRQVAFFAGHDADAKATFAAAVDQFGFAPVDVGGLADGGRLMGRRPRTTGAAARAQTGLEPYARLRT